MKPVAVLVICALMGLPVFASQNGSEDPKAWVEKQFVILKSTRDYREALKAAEAVSNGTGIRLDLRGLSVNAETGLTLDEKTCEQEGPGFPCYVARGRFDDGEYISIEHSSGFQGFAEGYYIVVAASYPKGSQELKSTLKKAKSLHPDAYIKTGKIFIGCIH